MYIYIYIHTYHMYRELATTSPTLLLENPWISKENIEFHPSGKICLKTK